MVFIFLFASANFLRAQNADIRWLREISQPINPRLDNAMKFTSNTVTPMIIGVPVGMFAYEYFRKDGDIRKPAVIGASLITTAAVVFTLKYTVNRPRPFVTYPDIIQKGKAGSKSFPSGHTSSAFALATSMSLCYPKWYVIAPAYTWAFLVGYSRMRLGVHYPSDVIAGAIIGAACSFASFEMNNYLLKK